MPTVNEFSGELRAQLWRAGLHSECVEINAGELHRKLGVYPSRNHSMPNCCNAMWQEMVDGDEIVKKPPRGNGATLTIRYRLPRTQFRDAIWDAINDFDEQGRERFLARYREIYKVKRGKSYFIRHNGKDYDLKAIVRVATKISGNIGQSRDVAKVVRDLGFDYKHEEEIILSYWSEEGRKVWKKQKKIERDRRLSATAIKRETRKDGQISCEACGFRDEYRAMFDVHHLKPLAAGKRKTTLDDLAVLCPTCHRWAHAKSANRLRPIPVEEIRTARNG